MHQVQCRNELPSSISVGYLAVGQAQVVQIQKTLATGLRVRFVLFCMSKFWLCRACPLLFKAWYAGVQNLGNIMPHWSCKRPCLASLRTLNSVAQSPRMIWRMESAPMGSSSLQRSCRDTTPQSPRPLRHVGYRA